MITLSLEDYAKLLADQQFLEALRAAGVDNWEGYEYAQEMLEEMLEEMENEGSN